MLLMRRWGPRLGLMGALTVWAGAAMIIWDDDPEPPPITKRLLWTAAAGLGALVVGVGWGRWLEGPRDSDED